MVKPGQKLLLSYGDEELFAELSDDGLLVTDARGVKPLSVGIAIVGHGRPVVVEATRLLIRRTHG